MPKPREILPKPSRDAINKQIIKTVDYKFQLYYNNTVINNKYKKGTFFCAENAKGDKYGDR